MHATDSQTSDPQKTGSNISRSIALIEAPSPLGLRPPAVGRVPGTRLMPRVLREAGLWSDFPLAAKFHLPEPSYSSELDATTGVRNITELIPYTRRIADAVTTARHNGQIPIIVGGDCSVMLGAVFALRRLGRYSLVHIDGHADFGHEGNRGKLYPNVAGADLAIATGRGPSDLTNFEGLTPYVRDEDAFQLGEKDDASDPEFWFADYPNTAIRRYPLSLVRAEGLAATLKKIGEQITAQPTDGCWVHLDLDVLDSAIMPAVDSPQPLGFTWDELDLSLLAMFSHPKFVGIDFTIYDPDLDPTRIYARQLVQHLRRALSILQGPPHCKYPSEIK